MRGVRFDWKDHDLINPSSKNQTDIGFIAQELQYILPEVVIGHEKGMYQVKYSEIISLCLAAIKEQHEVLTQSENKLTELEEIARSRGYNI